ncbi:ATP-dependent DNA helicase [Cupriavidus necator]
MTVANDVTLRVTAVRSQNPRGFGGAIFTGVPVSASGSVLSAGTYVVVKATASTLGDALVERGQWWTVTGPVTERRSVVDGFELREQQIEAESACLARPSGEHIVTYIAESPAFDGIGSVKARRLWERFGDELYDLLDAGEAKAFDDVLTDVVAKRLVEGWAVQGKSRTLQWLQAQGFDVRIGRKILRFFGDEAQQRIEEDPYRLLSFAAGWSEVDRLAMNRFGVCAEDPRRLRGAVEEACYRTFAKGHTVLLETELVRQVGPLLGQPPEGMRWTDLLALAVTEGIANGSVVRTEHGLQPFGALVMERQVAKSIQERLVVSDQSLMSPFSVDRLIAAGELEDAIELNVEQRSAIHLAAKLPFVCITGGAGVGKTTVLRSLYRLYDKVGVRILQVALAGRAAKRMQEATARPGATIASFLRGINDATFEGPTVLVIDESSMVDIVSMSNICQALPSHVRLVLVGDPHQLMPVGPGLVLHCVMQLPSIPMVELKTVKRYGGEIAAVAEAVRAGQWRPMSTDDTAAVAFIPCEEASIADLIVELYALDTANTQVLAPLRNGHAGTRALNRLCQQRFTGHQPAITRWNAEFEQTEHCGLNVGDAVLCTRNLWDKGLQNGSLGRIVELVAQSGETEDSASILAWINWDDGVRRPLTADMLEDIELGFAITIHKAQGSQWQRVIIPITKSRLLDRTLLYTAITRAQTQVILVGDIEAARGAVLAPPKARGRKVALDLALRRFLVADGQRVAGYGGALAPMQA